MENRFKKFWGNYSSLVVKLIVTQLGCTFFGLLLSFAGEMFFQARGSYFLTALVSCFATIFYLYLQFYHTKEQAGKDAIRMDAGRMERDPMGGLKCALLANAVNILLAVLAIVGKLFVRNVGFFESYEEGVEYLPKAAVNLTAISDTIAKFLEAMYLGIINRLHPYDPLMLLWIVFPSLIVVTATYAILTAPKK